MKATIAHRSNNRRSHGSAMLVALMLMAVCTIGIAAWVTIVNARNAYTVAGEDAMRRRVALENSRQLAEEYLYRFAATHSSWDMNNPAANEAAAATPYNPGATNDPNPAYDSSKPDIVERVQIDSWLEAPLQTNFADGRANRFSPANGESYSKLFRIRLGTGENLIERDFFVRSRSPIFSGDLVTLLRPNITNVAYEFLGHVVVNGRTVVWRPDMIVADSTTRYSTKSYAVMSTDYGSYPMENTADDLVRPSNFPFIPVSTGANPNSLGFDGRSSLVVNTYNDVNSLHIRYPNNDVYANGGSSSNQLGVVSNGSGTITVDLSNPFLKKVYIKNHVSTVRLIGQTEDADFADASALSALVIVCEQDGATSRNLGNIELYGRNNRRLIVGVKTTINPGDSSSRLRANLKWMDSRGPNASPPTSYPTWRLVALGENTELRLLHDNSDSEVTIYGGIMCDFGLRCHNQSNRRFLIEPDPDPQALVGLAPRNVWLESYNTP